MQGSQRDDSQSTNLMALHARLDELTQKHHQNQCEAAQARNILEEEVISKYWSGINKPLKPRDAIQRLRIPGQTPANQNRYPEYTTDSQKMMDITRDHHDNLQGAEQPADVTEREARIKKAVESISTRLTPEQIEVLSQILTREDIQEALKLSVNNKAPGPNSIPYEVYKIIDSWFENKANTDSSDGQGFDIIKVLQMVFNDIEMHGIIDGSSFAESWMCLLYKKNDRMDIANYRPISLLNTDYKIMTKAPAIKLAKVAPDLIHPSQAGFIPGRNIYDHMWLTKRIVDLAEVEEQNGMIVFLDQEKAYNKIKHDYLWRVLEVFHIPNQFTSTIKALYCEAYTTVYINGILSKTSF